jgi:hypothetical protein
MRQETIKQHPAHLFTLKIRLWDENHQNTTTEINRSFLYSFSKFFIMPWSDGCKTEAVFGKRNFIPTFDKFSNFV